jgi:hypothetical protein
VGALARRAEQIGIDRVVSLNEDALRVAQPAATTANATGNDELEKAIGRSKGVGPRGVMGDGHGPIDPNGQNIATVSTGPNTGPAVLASAAPTAERRKIPVIVEPPRDIWCRYPIQGAESVLARLAGTARYCYQLAINTRNPHQRGRIGLTLTVGPSGEVKGVSATNTGLDKGVEGCIVSAAGRLRFAADEQRGMTTVSGSFQLLPAE